MGFHDMYTKYLQRGKQMLLYELGMFKSYKSMTTFSAYEHYVHYVTFMSHNTMFPWWNMGVYLCELLQPLFGRPQDRICVPDKHLWVFPLAFKSAANHATCIARGEKRQMRGRLVLLSVPLFNVFVRLCVYALFSYPSSPPHSVCSRVFFF